MHTHFVLAHRFHDLFGMQIPFVVDNLCNFSPLQSHGPKVEGDSLQAPLLKDKKRSGSKAPAVVLGEQTSMFQSFFFL